MRVFPELGNANEGRARRLLQTRGGRVDDDDFVDRTPEEYPDCDKKWFVKIRFDEHYSLLGSFIYSLSAEISFGTLRNGILSQGISWKRFRMPHGSPDLSLRNCRMPRMNGYDIACFASFENINTFLNSNLHPFDGIPDTPTTIHWWRYPPWWSKSMIVKLNLCQMFKAVCQWMTGSSILYLDILNRVTYLAL